MESSIFRKVALDRLSSPEELDQLVRVTNPKGWLALFSFFGILAAAIIWGIYGRIPTQVAVEGVIVRGGGVSSVFAASSGMIVEIDVKRNDQLKSGQVIAKIAQPDLVKSVENARNDVTSYQQQYQDATDDYNEGVRLAGLDSDRQAEFLKKSIQVTQVKRDNLKEKIAGLKELQDKGLISGDLLDTAEDELQTAQQNLATYENQLKELPTTQFELKQQKKDVVDAASQKLQDAKNQLSSLELQLDNSTQVTSPYEGRVTAILASKGNIVEPGTAIIQLELPQEQLIAMMYVNAEDGKKVQKGMEVQVSPANVKQEEYGYIVAKVSGVSSFPASTQEMMMWLQNQGLVDDFTKAGNPYEVIVQMELDSKTTSGFKWSSRRDPPFQISSGTLCSGNVIVSEQAPISMVIPYIKEKTGI